MGLILKLILCPLDSIADVTGMVRADAFYQCGILQLFLSKRRCCKRRLILGQQPGPHTAEWPNTIAICAIMKDESAQDVKEFLEYHRCVLQCR